MRSSIGSFPGAVSGSARRLRRGKCSATRTRNPKQMEIVMPINLSLLSWLFSNPHVAEQEIALTTRGKHERREPLHLAVRWWGSHSPPKVASGLNERLLQDIGLDRSRS